ncbi:MAG: divergent polysaccharide deacetylase family protein [Gammaproteobacteria bacterium]|nr:divergent polysaccharide deacetylase family protein [Gammaproteobacteria bacterium]
MKVVFTYVVLTVVLVLTARAEPLPKIAIIIDDLGWQLAVAERAINLPGPVSCSVLPQTPRGSEIAAKAHDRGKDVLLHLPLQPISRQASADLGGITLDMSRHRFAEIFAADLAAVPHAVGINNHRGSLLTRHPGHMRWLMEEIGARDGLFFVDSYTTHQSVALSIAEESGIPARRRDVFLDTDTAPESVAREFERLKKLARRRGAAIGIGHPYPTTLAFLEAALPKLREEGFQLVGIRELVLGRSVETVVDAMPAHDGPAVSKGE